MPVLYYDLYFLTEDHLLRDYWRRGYRRNNTDSDPGVGDFNARVGRDSVAWKGALGKLGDGNCNDNGRLLLELCTELQLVITNTIFQQKDSLKTTWMHPRSKHWHLIDYILVRQRDLRDPKPKRGGPPRKKLHVGRLESDVVKTDLQSNLQSKLEGLPCGLLPRNTLGSTVNCFPEVLGGSPRLLWEEEQRLV
ncbi:hypothetical protein Bbelb_276420 [Branchiostoma belcheri]|nr:hypothetical protein Bbelb_276420 [Branchiostoma belcheri]